MSDSIPLSSIDFTANRDMGDLSGLQDSLRRLGTIHPPALSKYTAPDGSTRYKPVAGRRRLHALRANGVTELFHNSILDPERPGFAFKDEVPEDELQEATLDENLYRLKPKWQEDCLLVADVHELKRKKHGTNEWGVRQTASLLGEGYGKSNVSLALNVAKLLRAKDPEILAAENLMEANTIRIKRQEDKALAELQKRVQLPKTEAKPTGPVDVSSFLDSFSVSTQGGDSTEPNNRPSGVAVLPGANVPSVAPGIQNGPLVSAPPVSVPLSKMFFNMDFRKAYRLNLQVNHIVTDIPYGIDMKNLNASVKLDSVLDEHEVGANIDLMYPFLKFAYDTLLPHGFCVFFYDLDHHEKLQTWAKEFGFKVQRWPLIAGKTSACQNNAAQYNTTKSFEVAMVLRKDEHTVLRHDPSFTFNNSSHASYDFAAERKMYNNPFAKPFALWKDIYDIISFPGQSVLDPFCGEMSACRAAANCGLVPYGVEVNEQHYNRGLQHMKAVYATIHKSNCEFV
jgi:DNA modification methylase/ParB-like chromosome segregation protein Spo0J